MKIKMNDAGESPEFGPFEAGDVIDEDRASRDTMRLLVDRGLALEQGDHVAVKDDGNHASIEGASLRSARFKKEE